jgi:hypothetical protein
VRYIILLPLTLLPVACGESGPIENVLPTSPTVVVETVNAVCNTQITGIEFDVDMSGPHLLIGVTFAGAPSPVEIEIERYLPDGRTEPVVVLSNVVGRKSVALHFNTKYRGRARAGSCPWSPWLDRQIGPANACGDCVAPPPPPPPPPPPAPPKPPEPDDEDECAPGEEPNDLQRRIMRMEGPQCPPPPPDECESDDDEQRPGFLPSRIKRMEGPPPPEPCRPE